MLPYGVELTYRRTDRQTNHENNEKEHSFGYVLGTRTLCELYISHDYDYCIYNISFPGGCGTMEFFQSPEEICSVLTSDNLARGGT